MITAKFEGYSATSKTFQRLLGCLKNRGAFFKVWAHKTTLLAKQNARARSHGGKFWPSIANLTKVTSAGSDGAVVQCLHFAGYHKEFGGVIEAKGNGFLTIPIPGSKAVGKRAGEFKDTFVMGGIIFRGIEHGAKKGGKMEALFVLCKRTKPQQPEPWWPHPQAVLNIGEMMAGEQLEREMQR